jgi:lysozyme family protein
MDFSEAVRIIFHHEGGFVNHPEDPGGSTKFGISQKSYPHIDIHALTEDEAREIYHKDFWLSLKLDRLPPKLRLLIFDCAVNQGPARAIMYLQRACGAPTDGKIGPVTLQLVPMFSEGFLVDSIARQRLQSYIRHPKWSVFGAGWASRLQDVVLRSLVTQESLPVYQS